MLNELYSRDVLKKAAAIGHTRPLEAPGAVAERVSPVCGSRIRVEITVENGRITDYAQDIHACALGQSSAAIVGEHVIGKSAEELEEVAKAIRAMLADGAPSPKGEWADYGILAPVHDYSPRHGAVMLPLEATLDALSRLGAGPRDQAGFLTRKA
jgi:NifU-like protein involved in Fe-S cluster formation